jgi:hypothetical protein
MSKIKRTRMILTVMLIFLLVTSVVAAVYGTNNTETNEFIREINPPSHPQTEFQTEEIISESQKEPVCESEIGENEESKILEGKGNEVIPTSEEEGATLSNAPFSAPGRIPLTTSTYDYVIITTNDIVANSERLGNFVYLKELIGHDVLVVTEDDYDVLTGPPPNGRAEKIRQWLIDNQPTMGIDYVLLIGNPDPDEPLDPGDSVGDLPMKATMFGYFEHSQSNIPTDMYYADLQGDWDQDGDGYYAENVDFNNPESPDIINVNTDYFSARWLGYVYCEFTEEYEFQTFTDGGVKLWIDGVKIIDNWDTFTEHGPTNDYALRNMTAGWHDIKVEYKEHTGDAIMRLYYRTTVSKAHPNYVGRKIIPLENLRNETDTADGLTGRYYNNIYLTGSPALVEPDNQEISFIWATGDMGSGGPRNDADVWVGRIPVYDDDYEELDSILGKIIQYETDPGDISWRESILLPVWPLTDTTPAYQYPEEVLNDYAIAAGFSYHRIYKEDYSSVGGPTPEEWPTSWTKVLGEWQNCYGIVTWWTHGSETTASNIFSSSKAQYLNDSKPSFTFQNSCGNADPETTNNLAYSILKNGGVATIGSTRGSTGSRGNWTYNSASYANPNFGYAYFRGVIQDGMPAGEALVEAKKPTGVIHNNELNYNLFGDPETYLLLTFPNHPPVADANGPYSADEGSVVVFDGSASYDIEGDLLEFRWDLDGDGIWDTNWSSSDTVTFVWGDDYTGNVILQVRDLLGLLGEDTTIVTVNNVDPTIDEIEAYIKVNFTLRAAGEKWHNVELYVLEDGFEIGYAEVVRYPGSPDDQSVTITVICDVSKVVSVKVVYTPLDDPVNGQINGATPCWVNLTFEDGGYNLTYHNFNVQHPDRWEWIFGVNKYFVGHEITFEATASDVGSDDLTFAWSWDDLTPDTVTTYFNNGVSPDPYPSPDGIFPVSQFDLQGHIFYASGNYNVQLTVTDDDGGSISDVIVIILI